jgi:DNA polymerase-3 subunit alpha
MRGGELNRRAVENLIRAGAFDGTGVNRRSMMDAVEGILKSVENDARRNMEGQLDLFSAAGDSTADASYTIAPEPEYAPGELLQMEKDATGLYLSGHPLDAYRNQIEQYATHAIKDLVCEEAKALDNQSVRLVCTVVKNKMMTTKSNTMMAFTSVEDLTGTMEIIVFPRVLERCRDAIQDNAVVVISGRLSVREEEAAKLIAEQITPIDQYDPARPDAVPARPSDSGALRLYIRVPSRKCPQTEKVLNLLEIFDGNQPVILYLADTKQKVAVPRRLYTNGHPLFRRELERLLGPGNVAEK